MLDGERREMGVHNHGSPNLAAQRDTAKNLPMVVTALENLYARSLEPPVHAEDGSFQ